MIRIFLIIICCVLSFACQSQTFKYENITNNEFVKNNDNIISVNYDINGFTDVTKYLPKGFVTDGSVDYTIYIQRAINKHSKLVMPDFDVLINDNGLNLRSNSIIVFQNRSRIIMSSSKKGDLFENPYYALRIHKANNISIYNCNIFGDRNTHLNNKGEWGMGIGILGSSNIRILGGTIANCWGDGIYIGKIKEQSKKFKGYHIPSESIEIRNVLIDNNRRNGISVTSVQNLKIENCFISNTNGTLPMAGIDIEPNSYLDLIKNININNLVTYNNAKDGVLIVLTRIPSESRNEFVSINILNHKDTKSYSPLRIGSGFRKKDKKLSGSISIRNSIWRSNQVGIRYNEGFNLLPNILFENIKFENKRSVLKKSDDKYKNTFNIQTLKFN